METVINAIGRKPPGAELMVAVDFNVDILAPEGRRAENIATDLATAGVEDMAQHFMPHRPSLLSPPIFPRRRQIRNLPSRIFS